ncbi:MAG: phosphotransferase, partial [Lentilitoribacter sp.]
DDGILIVEDLGAEKPISDQNVPISERYIASAEMLAFLHSQALPGVLKIDGGYSHSLSHYDEDIMQMEIELLPDWYLPYKTGHPTESGVKNEFISIWRELFLELRKAETSLVLRDFHSPNIIWQPRYQGIKRVGLIDFQDALIGPSAYDLASLAQDARVLVSDELEQKILKTYRSIRLQNDKNFDVKALDEAYAIIAAQRASKVIGIFVRLKERDGKAHYLQHIPRIETYLQRLCHYPILKPLRDWLEKYQVL